MDANRGRLFVCNRMVTKCNRMVTFRQVRGAPHETESYAKKMLYSPAACINSLSPHKLIFAYSR